MSPKHKPRLDPSHMEDGKGTWFVVGLDSPGIEYAQTHHNRGYVVTDRLAESVGGKYRNQNLEHGGAVAEMTGTRLGCGTDAPQVIMAHTGTHMDTSGPVVGQLLRFYQIDMIHLVVIHDGIGLDSRCAKLKAGGSNGGHNGPKSIRQTLGTKDFAWLRIGAGHPPNRELGEDVVSWVLGRFPKSGRTNFKEFFDRMVQYINDVIESGLTKA